MRSLPWLPAPSWGSWCRLGDGREPAALRVGSAPDPEQAGAWGAGFLCTPPASHPEPEAAAWCQGQVSGKVQERRWHGEGVQAWVASVCRSGGKGFLLGVGAERRQIARPVCAIGLRPYKQMGPRSRKAEETRNVPRLTQHIPG